MQTPSGPSAACARRLATRAGARAFFPEVFSEFCSFGWVDLGLPKTPLTIPSADRDPTKVGSPFWGQVLKNESAQDRWLQESDTVRPSTCQDAPSRQPRNRQPRSCVARATESHSSASNKIDGKGGRKAYGR